MTTQQPWEYYMASGAVDAPTLDALGAAGWELVGVGPEGVLYFKRPALDFRERVTLEQKRRYYGVWGVAAGTHGDEGR